MSLHKNLTPFDVHIPYSYSYANAAARLADTGEIIGIQTMFLTQDVGKFARQLDDNSIWMLISTAPVWKQVFGELPYVTLSANRSATASGIYLRSNDNLPTNVSPLILPFDMTLIAISASGANAQTWTAEIHLLETLVPGATLNVVAATKAWRNDLSIDFNEGDGVEIYCNGAAIQKPNIHAIFRKR